MSKFLLFYNDMRRCKWEDEECSNYRDGYCADEDYYIDGVCPFEAGDLSIYDDGEEYV